MDANATVGAAGLWPGLGGPAIDYITPPPSPEYCRRRPRRLAILGSTGSVGQAAFGIGANDPGFFRIEALAGGRNAKLLAEQASRCRPSYLAMRDEESVRELRDLLPIGYSPRLLWGAEGYAVVASLESVDCVLAAQSGAAGLRAALAAVKAGKVVALANKESLVVGGALIRDAARKNGAAILPVDSEHFALFQCAAGRGQTVSKLILTASGGPFRGLSREEISRKSVREALRHPKWKMGAKITIDSATLMNKGLEFIEATSLFGVGNDQVDILVHPQSIIHSLVQFRDNSLLAQLAWPDMRLPIAACLRWPEMPTASVQAADLAKIGSLSFEKPDMEAFPCLRLAREAADYVGRIGSGESVVNPALVILNAANEEAVELFVHEKCGFGDIAGLIGRALDRGLERARSVSGETREDAAEIALRLHEETRLYVKNLAGKRV
ncbi:MAG: 1-deoxy-D-xylulose-5-phosphate reductoisomerase [Desulfovibrio sp.]|nr:1-deoxy-D-xylulose-5-phosphate reductoisomerase [Desulfovibrio sp.]